MERWKKLLCAVDGSENSFHSAEQARLLAKKSGAELLHLYVISTNLAVLPGPPLQPDVRQALQENAEEVLARLASLAEKAGVAHRGFIAEGDPADAILASAAKSRSDMVVVSARGATAIGRWLLGGNTVKIIQHAPLPVLVTRGEGPHTGYHRILCGVDGSVESEFAVRQAIMMAELFGSELRLCHVAHVSDDSLADLPVQERFIEEKEREWVTDEVDRLCAEAEARGVKPSVIYLAGNAADRILDYSAEWKADLIALGSRGLGGFSRLTLGSTSYFVCQYADASVLIARRPHH